MSMDDQIRWDQQHLNSPRADPPSAFLREIIESNAWQLPHGTALDIACGQGSNAIYLAQLGYAVRAVDISKAALEHAQRRSQQQELQIDWQHCDLETAGLPSGDFDLLISFNYLQRSLFRAMQESVKLGGHVIVETYLIDQAAIGHPKNPDYLLHHNELLSNFRAFRVLFYREGKFFNGDAMAFRAGIFAQRIK